jgi:hypothetical protein
MMDVGHSAVLQSLVVGGGVEPALMHAEASTCQQGMIHVNVDH